MEQLISWAVDEGVIYPLCHRLSNVRVGCMS